MINDQPEFWGRSFTEKREMWGLAYCAIMVSTDGVMRMMFL